MTTDPLCSSQEASASHPCTPWPRHSGVPGGISRRTTTFATVPSPPSTATWGLDLGERYQLRCDDEEGLPDFWQMLAVRAADTCYYVCGPEVMLNAVLRPLKSYRGEPFHIERFAAALVQQADEDQPFEIVLTGVATPSVFQSASRSSRSSAGPDVPSTTSAGRHLRHLHPGCPGRRHRPTGTPSSARRKSVTACASAIPVPDSSSTSKTPGEATVPETADLDHTSFAVRDATTWARLLRRKLGATPIAGESYPPSGISSYTSALRNPVLASSSSSQPLRDS